MSVAPGALSVIPRVSQLTPRVLRILGCNPSPMTLQGTNTYVIGSGKSRLLIDTGDGQQPEYYDNLSKALKNAGVDISSVILTHWHHDHVGGILGVVERLGLESSVSLYKYPRRDAPDPEIGGSLSFAQMEDGREFRVEGATLRAVHTPGHATDHCVLHLREEDAVFSGDCILGEGTAVFEDLYDYMRSLDVILALKPSVIYPAHGKVIDDPVKKIEFYISHRNQREKQILGVIESKPDDSLSVMEIVKVVYTETPEHLHRAAAANVSHHLGKLVREGSLERTTTGGNGETFRLASNSKL